MVNAWVGVQELRDSLQVLQPLFHKEEFRSHFFLIVPFLCVTRRSKSTDEQHIHVVS